MRLALIFFAILLTVTRVGDANAAQITFEKHSEIDFIAIEGEIEQSDVGKFQDLAIKSSNAVVVLNSPGGYLSPALEIGKIIQVKGFSTYVPPGVTCTSSCALIWVAGSPRMLSTTSRIGFHASYQDDNGAPKETGLGNAIVGRYLTLLNLPEKAVIFATRASPETIQWLDTSKAAEAGIPFETINLEDMEDSKQTDSSPEPVAPTLSSSVQSTPILAKSDYMWQEGTWTVESTTDRQGCFATNSFTSEGGLENESQLMVSKDRHETTGFIAITNEKFRSIVDAKEYSIDIVFRTGEKIDTGWEKMRFQGMITKQGSRSLFGFFQWKELERDMVEEQEVYFLMEGKVFDRYSLSGSRKAFAELNKCLTTGIVRELDDPFAR